jgi:alkylated DNA nucleotide flippase Atl1
MTDIVNSNSPKAKVLKVLAEIPLGKLSTLGSEYWQNMG